MGYYVSIKAGAFRVPASNIPAAYAAACALNDRDDLKSRGSFTNAEPRPAGASHHPGRAFAWMPADYPAKFGTLGEIFENLGFTVETDPETGALLLEGYENKIGDERYFLAAIAPFCCPDSFFIWFGEDGEQWRHTIDNDGQLLEWSADVTYFDPCEVMQ